MSRRRPEIAVRSTVTTPSDNRSPIAIAYQWASRVIVVAFEMVLPGLGGYWIDSRLGTLPLFMLIGFALGCTAAVVHLVQIARGDEARNSND